MSPYFMLIDGAYLPGSLYINGLQKLRFRLGPLRKVSMPRDMLNYLNGSQIGALTLMKMPNFRCVLVNPDLSHPRVFLKRWLNNILSSILAADRSDTGGISISTRRPDDAVEKREGLSFVFPEKSVTQILEN